MITSIIAWVKDRIWLYQFSKVPTEKLGDLTVKYFRGAYYAVDERGL